jgi:hypothetical protein
MVVVHMAYARQWVVDTLRRIGYPQEADEALRVLPEEIDLQQLEEGCRRMDLPARANRHLHWRHRGRRLRFPTSSPLRWYG